MALIIIGVCRICEQGDIMSQVSCELSPSVPQGQGRSSLAAIFDAAHAFIYESSATSKVNGFDVRAITDGNMNLVLQLTKDKQAWIVKHARPYVEKYPSIAAPSNRTHKEAECYQVISEHLASGLVPSYWGYERERNLLCLGYIEHDQCGFLLYSDPGLQGVKESVRLKVLEFAAGLHSIQIQNDSDFDWSNRELKALNHEHIFVFPFLESSTKVLDDFCLGLSSLAKAFIADPILLQRIESLAARYLDENGSDLVLLHGDLYPGSLLFRSEQTFVIDFEFCFKGAREFDLAVFFAHHLLLGGSIEQCREGVHYYRGLCSPKTWDDSLFWGFVGCEILRRLLGAARLPLDWSLDRYEMMLKIGRDLIVKPSNL